MTVSIGSHEFDAVRYDATADVLYLRIDGAGDERETHATPEGHAVTLDADGTVIGITLVNAKWLIEREGKLTITIPNVVQTTAEDLSSALG